MAKVVKASPKAGRLNEMLAGASAPTQVISNKPVPENSDPFAWMAAKTHSFRGPSGNTKAYPVAKTRAISRSTIASEIASEKEAQSRAQQSPVHMKGRTSKSRGSGHAGGSSLLHSTIRALEIAGEHTGNNQEVINSLVKD